MVYDGDIVNRIISIKKPTETGLIFIMISVFGNMFLGSSICGLFGLSWIITSVLGIILIFKGKDDHPALHEYCVIAAIFLLFISFILSIVIVVHYSSGTDEEESETPLVVEPPKMILTAYILVCGLAELLLIFGISGVLTKILMTVSIIGRMTIPWIKDHSFGLVFAIALASIIIFFISYILTYRRVRQGLNSRFGFWSGRRKKDDDWDEWDDILR